MSKALSLLMLMTIVSMNAGASDLTTAAPPVARKQPKTDVVHGETRVDDYFWLRNKSNPEVKAYLEAENAYTDAVMKPTQAFQESLYKEMLARIKETDEQVPYRLGDYFYYSRTEQGKQYPIYCRKKGSLKAAEEITLDLNKMAEGQKFFSLGAYQVSNDGHLLAFSTDTIGYRQYKLHVKDMRSGQITENIAERVTSVVWANDNKTVFYSQEDAVTKRSDKVFRHALGSGKHELLYEEKDELYTVVCQRTRSKGFVLVTSSSSTTSEVRYISSDQPMGELKLVLPRKDNHEYYLDHLGDKFFIRTNDQGKNFRLVTAPVSNPQKENWKEIIPHRKEVMLEDVDCFANYFIAVERENGLPKIQVNELNTGKSHYVSFPEPVYVASPNINPEFETAKYRFSYESLVTPDSIYDYDLKTHRRKLMKQQPVLGGYDSKLYQSERIY